jgi:hypothetical protein
MLALMACICAFVNFPYVIATWNVNHSKDVAGAGLELDFNYLVGLGPQALPAIERYLAARPNRYIPDQFRMTGQRDQLVARQLAELESWRAWSFRGYRLKQYIVAAGLSLEGKPAGPKGDKG